jgi:hypothetical protein
MFVTYRKPLFMKPTLLFGCALLAGTALHAQFSLLPYAGFEQSRNTLTYDNAFSASNINGNLKAGLRMDYRLRSGHSPFINLTTSPAPVSFSFDNAGSLVNTFRQNGPLFRLEGGYQYSSKPIQLGKKSSNAVSRSTPASTQITFIQRNGCGSKMYRSRCGERKSLAKAAPASNALNMRLQPSLALAYIPSATQGVKQTADGFEYTAGSWKTALVPAMGFEFAKGTRRLFTLSAFYTRPLGLSDETVTTVREGKAVTTNLQPQASTWGLTLGVPFGFSKTKAAQPKAKTEKKECQRTYYRRCIRM